MISSSTRVRVQETIFKYEVALEEKQTHQRVAWLKPNCPNGQVRGICLSQAEGPPGHTVLAIADTSSTEFLRRETADWG
jgi:hypothetical protein